MPRHAAPDSSRPGDRLVGAGAVVFLVGLVAVIAVVLRFLNDAAVPLWLVLVASTLPIGLGLALLGLLRSVLSRPGR